LKYLLDKNKFFADCGAFPNSKEVSKNEKDRFISPVDIYYVPLGDPFPLHET
jgi:hypothetical protein